MKILLIEDDRELAESMKFQLEKEGYETDICDDGEEGLYYMKERSHDLVILDRMLPSMDGITVLQEARKNHVSTPVIMLTALGELQDKLTGLKGGAELYGEAVCLRRTSGKNTVHGSKTRKMGEHGSIIARRSYF